MKLYHDAALCVVGVKCDGRNIAEIEILENIRIFEVRDYPNYQRPSFSTEERGFANRHVEN